jgi:DNA-binding CsgD family transcriptional regulator
MNTAAVELPEVAAKFYEAASGTGLWTEALDLVARAFGARGAILPGASFADQNIPHSHGMGPVLEEFFSGGWHLQDARSKAAQRRDLRHDVVTDQGLFSPDEMAQSPYYQGFARPAGVPWFCAATLSVAGPSDYVALSLQRSAAEGAFEAGDVARLRQLLPHLRNAAGLARRLGQIHASGVLDGLERAGIPAAILGKGAEVLARNQGLDELRHPALRLARGRLLAGQAAQQNALMALIAATFSDAAPAPLILRAPETSLPLILRATPYRNGPGQPFGTDGALIRITDPSAHHLQCEDLLRSLFDLTAREAQVMALLGQGLDLAQIAILLAVSRDTVRFHLKAILGKTGAHRQSGVVALCLRLAERGPAPRQG